MKASDWSLPYSAFLEKEEQQAADDDGEQGNQHELSAFHEDHGPLCESGRQSLSLCLRPLGVSK